MSEAEGEASNTLTRGSRWGFCEAYGCPLLGTFGRGGRSWCFCHFEIDASANDAVTHIIRNHWAVYSSVLDVHAWFGSDDWPRVYRSVQQRLLDAGRVDLLPDERDASPYRPGRPIMQQWLARLEHFLFDAVHAALRRAKPNANAKPAPPSSRDCVERMRATLSRCPPSPKWAFDLLDGIAAKPSAARSPESVRIALDAVASSAGRLYIANTTDEQRGRWCAALETLGGTVAHLVRSREPGEDDEPIIDHEVTHDPL
ncbi:hypothetical protein BDI4_910060 [Burkholderia diffusa]|uniref:hypothetical protein n=1 Tax=Burkholderia diffusa TaxID=488732 RepID=UPI001CB0EC09|nr:hypothetical protein [Burkholderia diffusa]CAG9265725.1 hypothetical protein BDI4_910060 [Burkholderia diffusa]